MTFQEYDYRVGVTGSRAWTEVRMIEDALGEILAHEVWPKKGWRMIVVHGACPTGADAIAEAWAQRMKARGYAVDSERHPANWDEYGKAAGPIRNAEMVDDPRGYEIWLAFYQHGAINKGTSDCADRARAHGYEVKRYDG
jgi:hypothetical protein